MKMGGLHGGDTLPLLPISRMSLTVWFGHEMEIPLNDISVEEAILTFYDMNEVIPSPFRMCSLVSSEEHQDARVIIGFPTGSLEEVIQMAQELQEWMRDNPLLYDIEYNHVPGFYSGLEWCPAEDSVDSDLETASESYTDESEESNADSQEDNESYSDAE